jgi:hypothetical protein
MTLIISITSRTALFEAENSLENSASFHPVSTSFEFATIFLLQSKFGSLASNSQLGGPGMFPDPAPGSLFVASYDSQGYG